MMAPSVVHSVDVWETARRFPRVPLAIPVEVWLPHMATIASSHNISMGGMLLDWRRPPLAAGTEIRILFNLPTGHSVSSPAKVVHARGAALGVRFIDLEEPARMALSRFLRRVMTYTRRGARLTRRMHVTIRGVDSPACAFEMAETIVISRHGGLLSTRAHFFLGDQIFLWWPDGRRGANVRVVNRRVSGTAGLVELGFEFVQAFNFWGIDFPDDALNETPLCGSSQLGGPNDLRKRSSEDSELPLNCTATTLPSERRTMESTGNHDVVNGTSEISFRPSSVPAENR
jgi:hypothetical protein